MKCRLPPPVHPPFPHIPLLDPHLFHRLFDRDLYCPLHKVWQSQKNDFYGLIRHKNNLLNSVLLAHSEVHSVLNRFLASLSVECGIDLTDVLKCS